MTRKTLARCFRDGSYTTEQPTDFWSVKSQLRDGFIPTLAGERKLIGSDVQCWTIQITGSALLVGLTDTKGQNWYSWIHAE